MMLRRAINLVESFNKKRIATSLSFLPVETKDAEEVAENVREYLELLESIYNRKLNSDITVKIHPFGYFTSPRLAEKSIEKIVKKAAQLGIFVWIDMERPSSVDGTISLFNKLRKNYKNLGICLQAYLKRSRKDLLALSKSGAPIRLVKGFYKPHDLKNWREVTKNYEELMELLLQKCKRPCLATHDLKLIEKAKILIRKYKVKNAEFQFFMGVRNDLAEQLVKEGFKVRIYVYYGHIFLFFKGLPTFDKLQYFRHILRLPFLL